MQSQTTAAAAAPPMLFQLGAYLRIAFSSPDKFQQFRPQVEELLARFDAKGYRPEEPLFVLRGQDVLASRTVQHWIAKAYLERVPPEKVKGAMAIAAAMQAYSPQRLPD